MARATKYRILACKRPAKHWVYYFPFDRSRRSRLYFCEYHWKKEQKKATSNKKEFEALIRFVKSRLARHRKNATAPRP
jgi:hypothetical protein